MMRFLFTLLALVTACGPGFVGNYTGSFSGVFTNVTPNTLSGPYTDTASIQVTDKGNGQLELVWKVGTNAPSGSIDFQMTGSTGKALAGAGVSGNCFMGTLTNGNVQNTCCDSCGLTFTTNAFTQSQTGHYTGTTATGVAYTGDYTGTWTATRN